MTYSHKPARKGAELLHNINGTTPRPQLPTKTQGTSHETSSRLTCTIKGKKLGFERS